MQAPEWRRFSNPGSRETLRFARTPVRTPRPGVRWDLVRKVRREIAQGHYETPAKWDAAVEGILAQLGCSGE